MVLIGLLSRLEKNLISLLKTLIFCFALLIKDACVKFLQAALGFQEPGAVSHGEP